MNRILLKCLLLGHKTGFWGKSPDDGSEDGYHYYSTCTRCGNVLCADPDNYKK